MKFKLVFAVILSAIGSSAYATCQYTPEGCPSTLPTPTSSSSVSGSATATSSNTNNNTNINSQRQKSSNTNNNTNINSQRQTAKGGNAAGGNATTSINTQAAQRAAAPAIAAPLTSSNDTCMGSSSGAIQAPGIGVSIGSTWTDKNCVMLKNSREMWNMGLKEAALARMCMDADNKEALEVSGVRCPARKQIETSGPSMTSIGSSGGSDEYYGDDPVVRRRLGLPVKGQ